MTPRRKANYYPHDYCPLVGTPSLLEAFQLQRRAFEICNPLYGGGSEKISLRQRVDVIYACGLHRLTRPDCMHSSPVQPVRYDRADRERGQDHAHADQHAFAGAVDAPHGLSVSSFVALRRVVGVASCPNQTSRNGGGQRNLRNNCSLTVDLAAASSFWQMGSSRLSGSQIASGSRAATAPSATRTFSLRGSASRTPARRLRSMRPSFRRCGLAPAAIGRRVA